ncbi:oxidoreductase [Myceligenerans pegani]|uniref:SDR family NAD(P)-dependent oxidoreductase n=1 Tax=Myceligenerans pegani TaxID=2776917 RepID=A0ABR9N6W1_9MICO|nr:oxidoreductase [Myceligenerans sp. TRM 65318]MBE1878782.1 SDR family NAD(P)-dependent oxidoreductase [Myceligenerans sp. TRM 65318]MBE3021053.1 SDR family NAD(P)-dependent oxidoreductase [Myceligenerans sp. TRM 65318]
MTDNTTKTWFITGASRGFGREFAGAALARGDRVAATARDVTTLDDLRGAYPDTFVPLTLDVTDAAAVRARVAEAERALGGLDVVVNNAGYGHFGAVEETTDDELRDQLETNVLGVHYVTRAVLPGMRERGRGHVLHVSSIGGVFAAPNLGAYCASKFAVEALGESLAAEVGRFGIHVTLVEPGGYGTDWAGSSARRSDPLAAYDPMRTEMAARRGAGVPGDPAAAAQALLEIVDAEKPPLRILLGTLFGRSVTEIARDTYERRLAEWSDWAELTERAQGAAQA